LVNDETGTLKSNEEIAKILKENGIDIHKKTVHYCGSGLTACVIDLGFKILGNESSVIYDGSWAEYGKYPEPDFSKITPKEATRN
jgi:thiosulfate/3-mercaptopyruvate sulfurtransferase